MKTLGIQIESVKGGNQYTVSGQGAKRHSTASVKMSDGMVTNVNRDVNKGGLVDGSNSWKKNRSKTGKLMIEGKTLQEAVFEAYANHGYVVVDGVKYVRGRDHAFRISPTDPDVVETFNVTISPDDHRFGWRPSFSISGQVPSMEVHVKAKAKAPRTDNGGTHDTQKVEMNRNKCLIQHRLNGALKAPKRK